MLDVAARGVPWPHRRLAAAPQSLLPVCPGLCYCVLSQSTNADAVPFSPHVQISRCLSLSYWVAAGSLLWLLTQYPNCCPLLLWLDNWSSFLPFPPPHSPLPASSATFLPTPSWTEKRSTHTTKAKQPLQNSWQLYTMHSKERERESEGWWLRGGGWGGGGCFKKKKEKKKKEKRRRIPVYQSLSTIKH